MVVTTNVGSKCIALYLGEKKRNQEKSYASDPSC